VITIRTFEPTDMFSVIKIASNTLPERYNPSIFNYFYETYPQGFIIAEIAHKIVGFLIAVKVKPNIAKILMLAVSKQHRRKKIGTMLLNELYKKILEENITAIELEVRTDNTTAIKFYEKHGFKIKNKLLHFYQNGEPAYVMRKDIL